GDFSLLLFRRLLFLRVAADSGSRRGRGVYPPACLAGFVLASGSWAGDWSDDSVLRHADGGLDGGIANGRNARTAGGLEHVFYRGVSQGQRRTTLRTAAAKRGFAVLTGRDL